MYLVDFNTFNEFISKKGLDKDEPPLIWQTPFILEYKRDDIILAKVEMSSIEEFKFLKRNKGKINSKTTKNKYWIRVNEWESINNQLVMKLEY